MQLNSGVSVQMKVFRYLLILFLAYAPLHAKAQAENPLLIIECDWSSGRAQIYDSNFAPEITLKNAERTTIDYERLIFGHPLPKDDSWKDGARQKIINCGPFTVIVSAAWWNPRVLGQAGADDFATVEIRLGVKKFLAKTGIGPCTDNTGRDWGECPKDWATRIELDWKTIRGVIYKEARIKREGIQRIFAH